MTPPGAPTPPPQGAATPAADPGHAATDLAATDLAATDLARALDAGGLTLAGLVSADRAALAAASVDATLRVYLLCGALASAMLARAIRVALASLGVAADIREGGYDAYLIEALDPAGALYAFKPDLVVVALGWRDAPAPSDLPAQIEAIAGLWRAIHDRAGARVLHHLMEPPDHELAGPAEVRLEDSPRRCVERFNAALLEAAPGHVAFLDLGALAMRVGLSNWNSPRDYFAARQPFAPRWLPLYAHAFAAVWRGMAARERKALVIDLDGSLWGGVIGDDGLDGVVFGAGSAAGEAYAAFAAYLKALAARGVTLAVCSKNDPELPRRLFAERADMPLRLTDFAAFHCNWRDKASNIVEIARELNIGLDAIAFADDNPAECALVRERLPQVAVVELSGDPSGHVAALDRARLFWRQTLTGADARRAESYAALRAAEAARPQAATLDDHLAGLAMRGLFRPALAGDVDRLAQMQARTNQFNLTTRRYDAADIAALMTRADATVFVFALKDRFADHGVVSSLVVTQDGATMTVDDWLMSCRVFSRTAEQFVMTKLVEEARRRGAARIVGLYAPTARNGVVADLYQRLGFRPAAEGVFELALAQVDASRLVHFIADEAPPADGT